MAGADHTRLSASLRAVGERMLADFESSREIVHRGSKGTVREDDLRLEFFRKYLPQTLSVTGSGEVISVGGSVSGQCDVMIVDAGTPPMGSWDSYRVVPVEYLYAIIEVKSDLTAAELRSAWQLIKAAKSLKRQAYFPAHAVPRRDWRQYGRSFDYCPTQGYVVAYEGATLETLGSILAELADGEDPALCIDAVFVLNRGYALWHDPATSTYEAGNAPGRVVATVDGDPRQVLMAMLTHLNRALANVFTPLVDILEYLDDDLGGPVQLWHPGDG